MIVFDESHNEFCTISGTKKRKPYSLWREQIQKYGLVYTHSRKEFQKITEEAKVIVIAEPHSYFTLEETFTLFDFVFRGCSLILIGNHHNNPRYFSYGCNEILNVFSKPFGIKFNTDEVTFYEDNVIERFEDHPLCKGIIRLHYWKGCSLTLLRQKKGTTAQGIAFGSKNDTSEVYRKSPVVAAVSGEGKIFCLGDSSVWADPKEELHDDNLLFADNVVKWAL